MTKWKPYFLAIFAVIVLTILDSALSSKVTSDLAARPVLALSRPSPEGQTDNGPEIVRIAPPLSLPKPDEGRPLGGIGVFFGVRLSYALPGSRIATCTFRFSSSRCSDGWVAERASE